MAIDLSHIDQRKLGVRIEVIGVGGAGSRVVDQMSRSSVRGADLMCVDTDARNLASCTTGRTLQLGASGLSAAQVSKARYAAELATDQIHKLVEGAQMVVITAGLGSGTGSGVAPVIASIANELGILTMGVVTTPLDYETSVRHQIAKTALKQLEPNMDLLIVLPLASIFEMVGAEVTEPEMFSLTQNMLRATVEGIVGIVSVPSFINVKVEDLRAAIGKAGKARMGVGASAGHNRASSATKAAVTSPLLEGIDLSVAKTVLVLICAAKGSLSLSECGVVMKTVEGYVSSETHLLHGVTYDESLGDEVRVIVVAIQLEE